MAIGAAIASAVVGAVISAGIAAATAPNIKTPDYGAANAAGIKADIDTLPYRRAIDAAAHLGGKTSIPTGKNKMEDRQFATIPSTGNLRSGGGGQVVPYVKAEWEPGGKYYNARNPQPPHITTQSVDTGIPDTRVADFTGHGDADTDAAINRAMNQAQLELEQKYGPDFIQQAKHELELSDPNGAAARKLLAAKIEEDSKATPDRPLANELDKQINDEVGRKGGITNDEDALMQSVLADRGSANGVGTGADYADMLTSGILGQQRREAQQQKGMSYLGSGVTPEDVQYRRSQQTMANEGAFLGGQTPQSQFANLSGAQNGAAPFNRGPAMPTSNPNAGPAYAGYTAMNYGNQVNAANNQVNPWLAGLSGLIKGAGAVGAAQK